MYDIYIYTQVLQAVRHSDFTTFHMPQSGKLQMLNGRHAKCEVRSPSHFAHLWNHDSVAKTKPYHFVFFWGTFRFLDVLHLKSDWLVHEGSAACAQNLLGYLTYDMLTLKRRNWTHTHIYIIYLYVYVCVRYIWHMSIVMCIWSHGRLGSSCCALSQTATVEAIFVLSLSLTLTRHSDDTPMNPFVLADYSDILTDRLTDF